MLSVQLSQQWPERLHSFIGRGLRCSHVLLMTYVDLLQREFCRAATSCAACSVAGWA